MQCNSLTSLPDVVLPVAIPGDMGNKLKRVEFSVRIRADLFARMEAIAKQENRSRAWAIEQCLEGHLPRLESEPESKLMEPSVDYRVGQKPSNPLKAKK